MNDKLSNPAEEQESSLGGTVRALRELEQERIRAAESAPTHDKHGETKLPVPAPKAPGLS